MCNKRSKEYFPIQIALLLNQISVIERYGANSAMIEACETISGVMAEQSELFTIIETSKDTDIRHWLEKRGKKKPIYSAHFLAIRDSFRLAKLVGELIEMSKDFLESGGEEWLNTTAGKNIFKDTFSDIVAEQQPEGSEDTEESDG